LWKTRARGDFSSANPAELRFAPTWCESGALQSGTLYPQLARLMARDLFLLARRISLHLHLC